MATGFPGLTASPLTAPASWPELGDATANIRRAGLAPLEAQQQQQPVQRTARLAYSPSQKKFFVGGYTFDDDNDTAAVTMSKYANQEAPLPEGDWQEVDPASYAQYVERIRDPGFFQQIANNFDIGLDEMQQTLGYGLMFAGAEETGRWLADQESDLAKTQIYQRNVENIGENGVLDWIAATIGRLGPNIVESVITAGAGAAAGSALAPGAGTGAGAVLGFFGKTAVKKALYEAAKKQFKGQALDAAEKKLLLSAAGMVNTASNAAKTKLAPGAFNQLMQEGLQTGAEAVAKRVAARAPTEIGAAGLSLASNIFQQTGQAYGETMAGGGPGDRAVALGVGTLGGLADTAGEFMLAGRVFSEAVGDVAGSVTKRQKALNLIKRIGAGAGAGAGMEGTTEAFQEALQIAANPVVNIGTPEGQSRLLNALAGGALLGGGFGGAGGIFAGSLADNKQEANLLLPVSKDDPNYAQYREDVKRQLGEAEYNKVFGPPQPYTRIMEDEARTAAFPTREEFLAGRAAQGLVPPSAMQPQGELFATSPMGVSFRPPVAPQEVAPAPVVGQGELPFVPQARFPVPAVPANIPSPAEMVGPVVPSGTQASLPFAGAGQAPAPVPTGPLLPPSTDMGGTQLGLFQTYAPPAAATPQGELLLRGGRGQAPARVPTGPMPQPSADLGGVQGILQPRREFPDTYGVSSTAGPVNTQLAEQVARYQRAQQFAQAQQQAAGARAERDYTEATIGQSITLDTEGASTGDRVKDPGRRRTIAGFNTLTKPQQDAVLAEFDNNEATLFDYVRTTNASTARSNLARLAGVDVKVFSETKVPKPAEPQPASQPIKGTALKQGTTNATQPGAGTGSAAPAGKQGSEDRGPSAGDKLRQNAKTTAEEPASKAQGAPTRRKPLQAEEDVQPAVEVRTVERRLKGTPGAPVDYLVTLSDGRTAVIYKDNESKDWRIDHPGARAFAPSQVGYVSDVLGATKKEAVQNVVEALDRMEAAVEEAKAANDQTLKRGTEGKKPTDLQQFLKTYADPKSFGGMRENENLADVVEYADWLGSLSKAELAKIEPIFSKRDNPFLNAGSMDVARARAKLEEAISPKGEGVAATPSKTAAEPELTDREVWIETFDDKGVGFDKLSGGGKAAWKKLIARKGGFTVADAEELQAQFEPKKTTKELAAEVRDKAKALIEEGLDNPNLPIPKNDLEELYFAVAKVRTTDGVDFSAALSNLVSYLGSGYSREAQRAARAYLDAYIEEVDVTVAKARLAAANKKAMEADKARAEAKKAAKAMEEESKQGRYMLSQFDAVENPIDENGRPAKGVNPIRVKAIVDNFKRGLAKAPQFYVYKNQADLQRRNPALYQQAVGSRPQGDFDTARASGFAFDGKVLVFTDRIPTEKYMRLLLAHESIGHFGMRALLPASKFDALMDYVYENNVAVRSAVDSKLGVRPTGVAPMSRRGFLKGTSSVIGAAVVPKMPRIPAKLDVDTFVTAYSELQEKLGNINNPDSVGKMGDLLLEILSPIKGERNAAGPRLKSGAYMASDYDQAVNKMDSILDNARRYVDDNMNRTLSGIQEQLDFGPDNDYLTYWFEQNEAEAAPLLKQFSSLIEEAYQKRNVEIADHVRSTLDMVKNKLGGSAKTEARSSTSEDVDMLGARREAVEEYMAKYAEKLDSSVITRVWNAIKDVLNKLGIKFEDDIVRYLVSQARRTVRNGSSMFTPSTFALNVHTITTNNGTGRFSTAPLLTDQHAASNAFFLMNAPPASIERANQTLKDLKIDNVDRLERFVRNFLRQGNVAALRSHGVEYHQNLLQSMATAAKELVFRFNQRLGALLALNGDSRRMVSNAFVVSRRIANRRYALPKDLRDKALLILGDAQPDETREIKGDEEVIRKLVAIGTLSKKELEDGAEVTYEEPTEGGKFEKVTVQIPGLKGLLGRELTQEEYDLYKKTREDLAALDVERLKGQFQNFLATEKISTKGIRKVIADKNMTEEDVTFVKGIVNHAKNLFISEIDYDERGIASITPKGAGRMEKYFAAINNAVVKREFTDDLKAEVRKFYLPEPTKDEDGNVKEPSAEALAEGNKKSEAAIKRIEAFRSRRTEFTGKEEQSVIYTLQDRIKEIVLADAAFDKAQAAVRRSIASSHVPLWREGAWQVRVEAQINGKPQKLHPEVQNKMILSLHEKPSEAENVAALINEKMKDLEYSGLVYNEETGEYKTQTFKLFAVPSKTVDSVASDPSIDIDNLLYTLRVLGQPLTPDKHAKAITMLTAPGSALRKALRFDDSPGYDPNRTIDAIARHVTTRASLIAKTRFQPVMRELLDRTTELGQKWFGDKEAVMTAKENFDKATDQKAKDYWQDTLTTELYKYIAVNPGAKGWDGSRATFPNQPTKASLGMRDYSGAVKTTEWLMDSANINESTFEGKRYAALAKMITSVGFLGGVMTQFAQNLMSFATNVFPLLASKDSQTGFGGGFGFAVMPMYLRSFKDANFTGFNAFSDPIKEAQAFDKIAAEIKAARDAGDRAKEAALIQQYNLNYYEALNIAREIREGKLIPSQALALLETARGIFTGRFGKGFLKFSDWYMLPFNISEQATRRASFLTAFRLEFDRLKQAGFSEDKASEMARMFAVKVVDHALGNYDASNRPPIWRDGLMSMLFVYKTYPLTSLSLFKNLSRNGKIGMLTALWVLAGAAGFPLVDDMEDFIDTLAQRLGLDIGQGPSVRMAIIRQLEEVFPGWSDFILRGPMNHYTGADVGAKFGLEDFIPGTGILLKGANTTEELKGIAGPVFGMGLSMGEFAYDAIRAPLSSTVSAVDVLRESPFSLMRAGGDVAAYLQNGAIVDRRGYVVTPEVSAMTLAARLLGFYPAEAAKQYDFIKYANRMNYDYKEVGMAYKLAWIKAKKAGNEREAARIVREVNEWNEANRGGPGFLRNFLKSAQRQLKEANRPAGERFLKAAPVASRAEYDRFLEYITGE